MTGNLLAAKQEMLLFYYLSGQSIFLKENDKAY